MKDSNQYQEVQLELPNMNTGFYVYMSKYSMNLPDPKKRRADQESKCSSVFSETQLSLAI